MSISWEEEEPNNQPTQRNFDPVNTELVCPCPGWAQTNKPSDVKVEMFRIETTEIISAHEHYKNIGEVGRRHKYAQRLWSLITNDSCWLVAVRNSIVNPLHDITLRYSSVSPLCLSELSQHSWKLSQQGTPRLDWMRFKLAWAINTKTSSLSCKAGAQGQRIHSPPSLRPKEEKYTGQVTPYTATETEQTEGAGKAGDDGEMIKVLLSWDAGRQALLNTSDGEDRILYQKCKSLPSKNTQ